MAVDVAYRRAVVQSLVLFVRFATVHQFLCYWYRWMRLSFYVVLLPEGGVDIVLLLTDRSLLLPFIMVDIFYFGYR